MVMMSLLLVLFGVLVAKLVLLASMRPLQPPFSQFELRRRIKAGEVEQELPLRRSEQASGLTALLRLMRLLVLAAVVLLAVGVFDWLAGVFVAITAAALHEPLAQLPLVRRLADYVYKKLEQRLMAVSQKLAPFLKLMDSSFASAKPVTVGSKDELAHITQQATKALTGAERSLVRHALEFSDRKVADIMTPYAKVHTIDHAELLGPLTLSELHKTGQNQLPVTEGGDKKMVGILDLKELLIATSKKTLTAAQAMGRDISYIDQNQTLERALGEIIDNHQQTLVVRDDQQEVVGLLSFELILEALTGQEIVARG